MTIRSWAEELIDDHTSNYYEGEDHYEICDNIERSIPFYKKAIMLICFGRDWLDQTIDECVREATHNHWEDYQQRKIETYWG